MLSFLNLVAQKLVAFVERRRASVLAVIAVVVFTAAVTGSFVVRPPILVPALDAVQGVFLAAFSQPVRLSKYFTSPRASNDRLMALELELSRLREASVENRRLRRLLDYAPAPGYETVPGRVIGLDLDPVRGLAWINVGSRDGISGGEPVLTIEGLAGIVDAVRGRTARIRLLRSNATPVGVRDTRSRVLGVAAWDPGKSELRVDYVPKQEDVAAGDTLMTSGLGEVFPRGLPVGTVGSVTDPPDRLLKSIRVKPFASFHRLEEIFVLVDRGGAADSADARFDGDDSLEEGGSREGGGGTEVDGGRP